MLLFTGYMIDLSISGKLVSAADAYFWPAFGLCLLAVYYYFFSKSWKRITVTATEIIIDNLFFKKRLNILYSDITGIGTYRRNSDNMYGYINRQNFVIEFNGNKSISINEGWYDNYDRLTMAVYTYKYGPGHGRERYLARRNG